MIKALVRWKIYIDRARAYIGYVQFLMLAVILAKQFGLKLGFLGSVFLVVSFFGGCLVVGYIDTRLGILSEEASTYNKQNPEITNINNKINKLLDEFENNRSDTRTR